jgi:hypothetical protein
MQVSPGACAKVGRVSRCRIAVAILATGVFGVPPALADYACTVTVNGVLPYADGALNVHHSGRGDWTIICNLTTPYTNGLTVGPTVCASWMVILLRAKKNNQQVQFWFPGTGQCSSIGTYGSSPVPTYVGEVN